MRHVLSWLALFWLWMLLAGEWNRQQWIAAAAAATIASLLVGRVRLAWVAGAWRVPVAIVVDFAVLVWALLRSAVHREVVRGEFVRRPWRSDDEGLRALAGLLATYSPNAYVVELDRHRRVVLVHDLVPFRKSEEPA